ncbi:hypothetical protein LRS10_15555 [Phenylobacterium sp. J426]|uniref:hypothetical protein n=1 Tax=Phenylobacterium sp. J426 TaxID=2898439 RepID=UPI002151BE26|nr:hypothetical protein [Phenylobacterium sp. J426]MCR5875473.1 hypothetical protein [Phenylobacterium sp. J426]
MDRSDQRNSWSGGGERGTYRGGHGEGEHEPWRRDRYGSLYDQDRTNYGSGYDPQRGEYGRGEDDRRAPRGGDRETWRQRGGPYGDLELNPDISGYEDFGVPHDYAYHPHVEHDADYLSWRDEQLRRHDAEYQAWRRERSRRYDEAYGRSRGRR